MRLEPSWSIPKPDPLLRWMLPGLVATGFALARFFPFEAMPPICPLRRFTGIPCIGCGATRSWVHMAHLRIGEAFIQSPLGTFLFFAAAVMMIYILCRSASLLPAWRLHTSRTEALLLKAAVLILLGAHWLYLILSKVAE